MKVALFVPCFVDAMAPQAAIAMVRVLERLGCELTCPPQQTCCGQPAHNAGYHREARRAAEWFLSVFRDAHHIVVPSGSCAAMVKVHFPRLFGGTPQEDEAVSIGHRTHEFSDFVVGTLGITDTGSRFAGRVTYHDGCHGLRELGLGAAARALLASVRDLELVEMSEATTCCGFGGTFAVKFPLISGAMAETKASSVVATGAAVVVSTDPSCLLHLDGYFRRHGHAVRCLHLAEVLAST